MSVAKEVLQADNKTDWGNIYTEPTPVPYFDVMTPTDYGHYHDRFLEIFDRILKETFTTDDKLKVVEVGTSYGNTTLAYRCGLNWNQTGEFWKDESQVLKPIRNMHVTALDMSVPALNYGLRRGVFDAIIPHDFNSHLTTEIIQSFEGADVLVSIMISSYIKTLAWQRLFFAFLGDRSKTKIIAYNDTCAFDTRNLSPEVLFAGVRGWSTSTHFTKHRNFTAEESVKQHGCKESWSYTYVVTFEALDADNKKIGK